MKPDAYPLAEPIEAAYRDSPMVVFEADIAAMDSPDVQAQMLALSVYTPPENLRHHLPPSNL